MGRCVPTRSCAPQRRSERGRRHRSWCRACMAADPERCGRRASPNAAITQKENTVVLEHISCPDRCLAPIRAGVCWALLLLFPTLGAHAAFAAPSPPGPPLPGYLCARQPNRPTDRPLNGQPNSPTDRPPTARPPNHQVRLTIRLTVRPTESNILRICVNTPVFEVQGRHRC